MINEDNYNMTDFAHPYSLKVFKSAFNTENIELKDVVPVTISFDPARYVPSGSPGVVLKNDLLTTKKNQLIRVLFPFPAKRGVSPKVFANVNHKNLYFLPKKNLVENHKVKIVDTFKKSRLYDIGNYTTTNAAITFTFSNLKAAFTFWKNIPYLCSIYKYTAFFYHMAGGRKRKTSGEEFIPFVSFIDLPYCIPIFDYRKVEGIGVYCGFIYKNKYKEGERILYTTKIVDTLCFVLSNHQANIFYTDGVKLGNPAKIDKNIISYMSHFIETEIVYERQPDLVNKIENVPRKSNIFLNVKTEPIDISITNTSYENIPKYDTSVYTSPSASTSTWR